MFTINIYVKFALIAFLLGGGILLAFMYGFLYASLFIFAGLILLGSYLLLGTVQSAAQLMQEMRFEEAEKRLDLTFKPDWLFGPNKAYYHMIKGTAAINRKDNEKAEYWFNIAKDMDLPSDNERGMVLLQLSNLEAAKGKWTSAENHFRALKKLNLTEPQLRAQVAEYEKALKSNKGNMKNMRAGGNQSGAMMHRGGKRRRPKMR